MCAYNYVCTPHVCLVPTICPEEEGGYPGTGVIDSYIKVLVGAGN